MEFLFFYVYVRLQSNSKTDTKTKLTSVFSDALHQSSKDKTIV